MNQNEKSLLEFVSLFINKGRSLRRNRYQHISYIIETINMVYRKHFEESNKFNSKTIIRVLEELKFNKIEDKNSFWKQAGPEHPYTHSIWYNVDTKEIRLLRLTLSKIPLNTNEEKVLEAERVKKRLNGFKANFIDTFSKLK